MLKIQIQCDMNGKQLKCQCGEGQVYLNGACENTDDYWGMGICCYDEDTGDMLRPCPMPEVTTTAEP